MHTTTTSACLSLRLTVDALSELDEAYPKAQIEAIARSIPTIEIYKGDTFVTSVEVATYQPIAQEYDRLLSSKSN